MRRPSGVIIVLSLVLLFDLYDFQSVLAISHGASSSVMTAIYAVYWTFTLITLVCFLLYAYTGRETLGQRVRTYLFAIMIGLFMAKVVAALFFLGDDIRRGIQWVVVKLFYNNAVNKEGISRSVFMSWLGLAAGGTLFGSLLYGFSNKYNYQLKRVQLAFNNLPAAFRGFKIIHISDIHSGSFTNKAAVSKGVQKIIDEQADIILFTGDLVNDRADEMHDYMDIFSRLKAPMGVYSTLGNHDYGDYVSWPKNGITKEQNLDRLKGIHNAMGWRLLMNEHVILEKDNASIALLGIENWSAKARFPKHGRMDLAHPGTEIYPFKILMSHDPSHWDAEVLTNYPDIDLVLSGHTHGMQFGFEMPGLKWSPVQYMYKQWKGLYEKGNQKLYVNPGYGFIGYPGRVGILPEITVIELI